MGRARDRASADLNGQEFILDADADTSISADTDDQIDIKIAGADDFAFKANTFEVQTGSNIDMNGTELILDADGDTSITADTDDRIDFRTGGGDRLQIQSTSGNNVVVADGLTLADGNLVVANGHGIDFSSTADGSSAGFSELFHDYEEGIFSCVLTPGSSGSITMNGSYNDGYYVKVGNLVTVFGDIRVSSVSSPSGDLRIALPFTVLNDSKARAIGNVLIYGLAKQTNQLGGFIVQANANTALGLIGYQTDASTHVNLQTIGAGDEVKFTITYRVEE
jgi:hypothetical protein